MLKIHRNWRLRQFESPLKHISAGGGAADTFLEHRRPYAGPALGAYSIGQLSRLFNTSRRALRQYESKGLLEPGRDGAYRLCGRREYQRLAIIVEARKVSLSIEQIYDLLNTYDADDRGEAQIIKAPERVIRRMADLNQMRDLAVGSIGALETRLDQARAARSRFGGTPRSNSASDRVGFREPEHQGFEVNP